MYIKRNEYGHIEAVSDEQTTEFNELADDHDPEFIKFLKCEACKDSVIKNSLEKTDTELVRVLEDVIEILISKNVIQFTDLPKAARDKLSKRQNLRENHRGLMLLDDHEDDDSFKNL